MTPQELQNAVETYITGNQLRLVAAEEPFGSAPIKATISRFFRSTLSGTVSSQPHIEDQQVVLAITYTSSSSFILYPVEVDLDFRMEFFEDTGTVHCRIHCSLPESYRFENSFSNLKNKPTLPINLVQLQQCLIILESQGLEPSIRFEGRLQPTGPFSPVDWIVSEGMELSGSIQLDEQAGVLLPIMDLRTSPLVSVNMGGNFDISPVACIKTQYITLQTTPVEVLHWTSEVYIETDFSTDHLTLPVRLPLYGGTQYIYSFYIDDFRETPNIDSLSDLSDFTGGDPAVKIDTSLLPLDTASFSLAGSSATFSRNNSTAVPYLSNLSLHVNFGIHKNFISNLLVLEDIGGIFRLSQPTAPQLDHLNVELYARLKIGSAYLKASIFLPDWTLEATLGDRTQLDINELISTLAQGVTLPENDQINIYQLRLFAHLKSGEQAYFFEAAASGQLIILEGFILEDLQFSIGYEGGHLSEVGLGGAIDIAGVELTLGAAYESDTASWQFEGHSIQDQPIPFGALMHDVFLKFDLPDAAFPAAFEHLEFSDLAVSFNSVSKNFTFSIFADFPIAGKRVHLELDIEIHQAGGGYQKEFSGSLIIDDTSFTLQVVSGTGNEAGTIVKARAENILVGSLLTNAFSGVAIPDALSEFIAESRVNVAVAFDTSTHQFAFTFTGSLEELPGADIAVNLMLNKKSDGKYHGQFTGHLALGTGDNQRLFDLVFHQRTGERILMGLYRKTGGEKIPLSELLGALTHDIGVTVPPLDFKIMDALFVLIKNTSTNTKKYFFTTDMDFGIDLSGLGHLPLVGRLLPLDDALRVSFQPMVSKEPIDLAPIKALLADGVPDLPDNSGSGFQLLAKLKWGGEVQTLAFGLGSDDASNGLGKPQTPPVSAPPPTPQQALAQNANVRWIDIQKDFTPLHIGRIGIGYTSPKISVLLDASLAVGPLKIGVIGLGGQYDMNTHHLSFRLDGLALAFNRGPLEIGGAFLKFNNDFVGRVNVRFKAFSITALGAYGEDAEGKPSLFLYALILYPLGGPAFFFVEGLAFGFGYNRDLDTEKIGRVSTFPFVAEALNRKSKTSGLGTSGSGLGTAIRQELSLLSQYIKIKDGQYFITAGIKFNSFKLIDTFALAIVNFGRHLDITVMGVSSLVVPSAGAGVSLPTLAKIEMEFKAFFDPENGIIKATADLTPASYLFTKKCSLSGGFAFYTWMLGPHAGDFVVSIGGYHPDFHVPAHYPSKAIVPRLRFHWGLDPNDTQRYIKGEAYYALTPHAIMAGGKLEAHYHDSGSLWEAKAWFSASADFLINWKPFHYDARFSVSIGGELTIYFLGTHHFSLEADASVHVWGPEFAGTAHVHAKFLGIPVDFDAELGNAGQSIPGALSWKDFVTSFLPHDPPQAEPPNATPIPKGCSINLTDGMVSKIKDSSNVEHWVINPKEFHLTVDSHIPFTSGPKKQTNHSGATADLVDVGGNYETIGIDPMEVSPGSFHSHLVFKIFRDGTDEASNEFHFEPVYKQYPVALWTTSLNGSVNGVVPFSWRPGAQQLRKPKVNGQQVIRTIGGYHLRPKTPPTPGVSSFIPISNLQYDVDAHPLVQESRMTIVYSRSPSFVEDLGIQLPFLSDMVFAHFSNRFFQWIEDHIPVALLGSLLNWLFEQIPVRDLEASLALETTRTSRNQILTDLGFDPANEVQLQVELADSLVAEPQYFHYDVITTG